jgi:hypothetical protein
MNRKLLFLVGAVALVVALSALGRAPKVFADPFTYNFDITMCDGKAGANDPTCINTDVNGDTTVDTAVGDGDGSIENGESPEVKTHLTLDLTPAIADENIFGLANTVWQGITPTDGTAITDGDQVGEVYFSIESSLLAPLTSNVSGLTGQPPACATGVQTLSGTVKLYDGTLALSPTVSHTDTDGDGFNQTDEDNFGPGGVGGPNGLLDGIDKMPEALATTVIPNVGLGNPTSRSYGVAIVSVSLGVEADVSFMVFPYDLNGDTTNDGYLSVTVLNYPGVAGTKPGPNNITGSTVVTCPPFTSLVRIFGKNLGNTAKCSYPGYGTDPCAASPNPNIAAGTINRIAVAGGPYPYYIDLSSANNYDGDAAAQDFDSCETTVSTDSDLPPAGTVDPDSDRWDSSCDPAPGSADNAPPAGAQHPW